MNVCPDLYELQNALSRLRQQSVRAGVGREKRNGSPLQMAALAAAHINTFAPRQSVGFAPGGSRDAAHHAGAHIRSESPVWTNT